MRSFIFVSLATINFFLFSCSSVRKREKVKNKDDLKKIAQKKWAVARQSMERDGYIKISRDGKVTNQHKVEKKDLILINKKRKKQ